jgi:MFS family permease
MYLGNVAGFFIITLVGDFFGRKMLLVSNLLACVVGLLLTIFCVDLTMAAAGLFLMTLGIQNAFNVCFYFISETVSESHRESFSVAIQLFYGLGVLLNVLWFYTVADWQIIYCVFYFVPLMIVVFGVAYIVKDTPICLVTRNKPIKAL